MNTSGKHRGVTAFLLCCCFAIFIVFILSDQTNIDVILPMALKASKPTMFVYRKDSPLREDNGTIAKTLEKNVRILCWIMTCPQNHESKARHVMNTWAKRCNKVIYISSKHNTTFPAVGLNVSEGRKHLTTKTMTAFKYIYKNHINDADWFLKADDDTYVVVENLRHLLSSYSPKDPVFLGQRFQRHVKQGYYSGGAGYVLSKESVRRLVKDGIETGNCSDTGQWEDVDVGKCMETLGIKLGNSTDSKGRSRFHCFAPENHLLGRFPNGHKGWEPDVRSGSETISEYAVSFHHVRPDNMYVYEFFLYRLRPFGIHFKHITE
ncbi:glycoprotein-N-acetylgalactosamine 3-beta-galactosyltransferase 1-B-like isoform X2 [Mizuhopecten yessoensis]|uniref:glycoprotein-N-acetylgalactosamine 3-beta-galactosyltransferase 1-B-like isoform X2 n=1 Tax=Mizuhopecten yessoensis TaxID=6573 RepID=UPI000B45EC47|nr:glycoprotein-N-acetylgalactosamine 3-beta-galactosyltransferase 1-B-like isoform X2 [Mizuhopecten yessoensis]